MTSALAGPVSVSLTQSQHYCRQLAGKSRSNFFLSFFALPAPMFRDMCVLYAYMRRTDDLGDDPAQSLDQRREALRIWRGELRCALDSNLFGTDPILPALTELAQRRQIPHQLLFDVITGVESDLAPRRFADATALERYCYHVAGVVGLCCLQVWGDDGSARARELAITCGLAFQLTNILRDIREDASQGRVYLPTSLLEPFGCTEQDLHHPSASPNLQRLISHQLEHIRRLYAVAGELQPHLSPEGQRVYRAMHQTYGELLRQMSRPGYDVLAERARLSPLTATRILVQCWWSRMWGS
jgi:phytoene synthase